jgi:hypothetical protein
MNRKTKIGLILSITVVLIMGGVSVAIAEVPNPLVTGPIPVTVPLGDPSRDYPQLATQLDLSSYGYIEEEFYLEGTARLYDVPRPAAAAPPASQPAEFVSNHPYKTRMIVRRPISSKDFNGTVIMDWLNVTSQYNLDAMWLTSYAHILREGYAYVGVSVQRVGIHAPGSGLREWSPLRYGDLDVTDNGLIDNDGLSFDIWSQAAQAIWSPQDVDPLGGLRPLRIIATGASQSQNFLVYYHNSIHPLHNIFDGFLLYIGTGRLLRTDLDTKVIKLNTENDVIFLGEYFARQLDSSNLRTYEVAGTSHVGFSDPNLRGELLVRDGLPIADTTACARPALSRIPTNHVANAAFDHLTNWITYGVEPPTAPLLEVVSAPPVTLRRDEYGNALGGIQLSQHAVATATNTGFNSGPGFCFLFGSHEPFDEDTLRSLYRNHGQYASRVVRVVNENLADGYIVQHDAIETRKKAAQSDIGKNSRR